MQGLFQKPPHQVLLSLDSWHVRNNLDFIETHQPDAAELIPHIDLAALTSHITSRSHGHIQLSCFGVSLLFMSRTAFLAHFVFRLE